MTNSTQTHLTPSERIGQFRLKIIGGLLASPPDKGNLKIELYQLAQKPWLHPISGSTVHYSKATLERWYYKVKNEQKNLLKLLSTSKRCDHGTFKSLNQAVGDALTQQYHEHESWSVQLHYDNLLVRIEQKSLQTSSVSYSSILRYMRAKGMNQKYKRKGPNSPGAQKAAKRLEQREVRSYEIDHINGLWHLDFHHGSLNVLNSNGQWVKPLLLAIMDDRSRLICHMQWYYNENTECLVHGFCQALQKRAVPRALLTDNGSAMISGEFTHGLLDLGIDHRKTLPYSPYQNGKQETFWGNVEGRLLAMLENQESLTLRQLNQYTQAWVERDYHQKINAELDGQTPIECYLHHRSNVGRDCPETQVLQRAFRKQAKRKQRRSDGTISLEGKRFEIPNQYETLKYISLRYASWDLSVIDMVDEDSSTIILSLYPLNKSANANSLRRTRISTPEQQKQLPLSFSEPPPYLQKLMNEYAATGLPSAYVPKDEIGEG